MMQISKGNKYKIEKLKNSKKRREYKYKRSYNRYEYVYDYFFSSAAFNRAAAANLARRSKT